MAHIVWDWNGTLFDDIEIVVAATNEVFRSYGLAAIDLAAFRAGYTRPIWLMYGRLLGRPLNEGEWERLDLAYHDSYHRLMDDCALATDALDTVAALQAAGHTQSLLSMWDHDELVALVRQLGVDNAFVRVDGLRTRGGGGKTAHLLRHLEAIAPAIDGEVLMVGDTTDDATAAQAAGIRCVLMEDGPHPREALTACNVPLAGSLVHALELGGALTVERSRA